MQGGVAPFSPAAARDPEAAARDPEGGEAPVDDLKELTGSLHDTLVRPLPLFFLLEWERRTDLLTISTSCGCSETAERCSCSGVVSSTLGMFCRG